MPGDITGRKKITWSLSDETSKSTEEETEEAKNSETTLDGRSNDLENKYCAICSCCASTIPKFEIDDALKAYFGRRRTNSDRTEL